MRTLGSIALVALPARTASAGVGVVNANQIIVSEAAACWPSNQDCAVNPNLDLPLDDLSRYELLDASSFHGKNCFQMAQARCFYDHRSKSKVLSSDPPMGEEAEAVDPAGIKNWILAITDENEHPRGSIHFEHFDACLEQWAMDGNLISTYSTFPDLTWCNLHGFPNFTVSPQQMLIWFRDHSGRSLASTRLFQNGWLHRSSGSRYFKWKAWDGTGFVDEAKRLVGTGLMGAIAADSHLDSAEYFKTLRAHNVNLTRVWAVEMWVGLAPGLTGLTPFEGQAGDYDLDSDSPAFYDRLRKFSQDAADRGIVVQLSLFDKHGLIWDQTSHRWLDSPFNQTNNQQGFLEADIPDEDCDYVLTKRCYPLYSFIEHLALQAIHGRYLRRIGEEVGGIGNLIFEIINEARSPDLPPLPEHPHLGDWWDPAPPPSTTTKNEQWQMDMAKQMKLALPLSGVKRDAFNGDDDGTPLLGKSTDVAGTYWWGNNAQVRSPGEAESGGLGPPRKMGYVTSQGAEQWMQASVAVSSASVTWTKVQVRADVTFDAPGTLEMGLSSPGPNQVFLRVTAASPPTAYTVRLIERHPSGDTYSGTFSVAAAPHDYRLKLLLPPPGELPSPVLRANIYVDGEPMLEAVPVGTTSSYETAFFRAQDGSVPYPADRVKVDNFEVARFCDDETRGCTPLGEPGSEE